MKKKEREGKKRVEKKEGEGKRKSRQKESGGKKRGGKMSSCIIQSISRGEKRPSDPNP